MSSQFKNRLVGVTIVVASVVIFLPSIIDGKKSSYQDEFVATPIKPIVKDHTQAIVDDSPLVSQDEALNGITEIEKEVQSVDNTDWEIQEVAAVVTIESEDEPVNEMNKQDASKTEIAKKEIIETSKVAKKAVPEKAWAIQLGAFQNAANINILLKKLHKAGFQAHTIPSEVIDGQLTRVFVGPDISKDKLEKQLPQLKRLTNLKGQLIPFNAVNP